MLSENERQQFANIEARLRPGWVNGSSRSGPRGDDGRARDRARAMRLAASAVVVLLVGRALSLTWLSVLGALWLYVVTVCWWWQNTRACWGAAASRLRRPR